MGHRPFQTMSALDAIKDLKTEVFDQGRSVVPLLGAGISSEAGIFRLSEVTEYLAKTKGYIRHKVYAGLFAEPPVAEPLLATERESKVDWRQLLGMPTLSVPIRDYLRNFGWPDPQELDSELRHWIESRSHRAKSQQYPKSLADLVTAEILDSLGGLDSRLVHDYLCVPKTVKANNTDETDAKIKQLRRSTVRRLSKLDQPGGKFWKVLLTDMTRSGGDLVDTLFQKLTQRRAPATSHRFLALLTPILRLRLFLTTNFDTLLEDALRLEGFRPTVFEVADGLSLPHPKLMNKGISIVKLHGGAFGLMIGDRLDSPLDEETRERFKAYLPQRPILLVLGFGGEDHRILDMLELVRDSQGDVYWLCFQNYQPRLLLERFGEERGRLPTWIRMASIQDPGAFLRQLYSIHTGSHPSSSVPFSFSQLPPVLPEPRGDEARQAATVSKSKTEKAAKKRKRTAKTNVHCFEDSSKPAGLGASECLAELVASKRSTHRAIWIDLETKFTLEDLVAEIIQQIRRFDPGLPPEIFALERLAGQGTKESKEADTTKPASLKKVVRRLYAAMARNRYILALNAIASFGSSPTKHHDWTSDQESLSSEQEQFIEFLIELLSSRDVKKVKPKRMNGSSNTNFQAVECLGILDSVIGLALDQPCTKNGQRLRVILRKLLVAEAVTWNEIATESITRGRSTKLDSEAVYSDPAMLLICTCRRRRNVSVLYKLLPKYICLDTRPNRGTRKVEEVLKELEDEGRLKQLEGGEIWMGRGLRNSLYGSLRDEALQYGDFEKALRAAITLACVHLDLATYFYREIYVGSQDVKALKETLYHRLANLRYMTALQGMDTDRSVKKEIREWLGRIQKSPAELEKSKLKRTELEKAQAGNEPAWIDPAEWLDSPKPLLDEKGRINGLVIARLRLRGLRTLRNTLEQEKDAILSRFSAAALKSWISFLVEDLEDIASIVGVNAALHEYFKVEKRALQFTLDDLEVEVRLDHMESSEILRIRRQSLLRFLNLIEKSNAEGEGEGEAEGLWLIQDKVEPTTKKIAAFFSDDNPESEKLRAFRALLDCVWAYCINPWLISQKTIENLREKMRWILGGWLGDKPERIPSNELLEAKACLLRLEVDMELWGKSPWDTKGRKLDCSLQVKESATLALRGSEYGLAVFDNIQEHNRAARSYFHSLEGRAYCLLGDYSKSYRYFDLARSGLREEILVHREALAIALLRQAEALMLHADQELTDWVINQLTEVVNTTAGSLSLQQTISPGWAHFLSAHGYKKLGDEYWSEKHRPRDPELKDKEPEGVVEPSRIGESREEQLLRLSLANHSPEMLSILENLSWSKALHDGLPRREIPFATLRSRLAAALDCLDRVEKILEAGRRNVQWWACLFQLRAQWAVEQLLLLLAGDLTSLGPIRLERQASMGPSSETVWKEVQSWIESQDDWFEVYKEIKKTSKTAGKETKKPPHRAPKLLLAKRDFGLSVDIESNEEIRKLFIHRFRNLVRQGLISVRQGLDILLPGSRDRQKSKRLYRDILLRRLLRLWAELFVCGASAHIEGEQSNPQCTEDFNLQNEQKELAVREQWEEWLYLNQIAGLVHLPRAEGLEDHFMKLCTFEVQSPSLAARAQTLAKIDYILSCGVLESLVEALKSSS